MNKWTRRRLGIIFGTFIDTDPDESNGENFGGGGSGGSKVRDPEKLLERYETSKTEIKTLKASLKEFEQWKNEQEAKSKASEEEILRQQNDWKALLERKEEEYKTGLATNQTKFDEQLAKYQGYENDLKGSRESLESLQSEVAKERAFNGFLRGLWKDLDPGADLDYFEFKFRDRFSVKDGKPFIDDSEFNLEEFKKSPETQMFWRKINPEGSGTTPGTQENIKTGGIGELNGTLELPRSIYSDPMALRKWYESKQLDYGAFQKRIMSGSIKVVDG